MSTTSDTYACSACTLIQSIKRSRCEVCNEPNPSFSNLNYGSNTDLAAAAAAAIYDLHTESQVVQCFRCNYINIGSHIRICEGCGENPSDTNGLFTNFPMDYNNETIGDQNNNRKSDFDSDDSGNEVLMLDNTHKSQKNDEPQKIASAVEKGMDNNQLVPYFNRYILILSDQQHQKKSFAEEFLYECMTDIFESLEYKNDQSDGQLTFSACQICYDEDVPMVTMQACGHRVVCIKDFNQYLSVLIRDGNILPWIPCPAETCLVPCHVKNIIEDGGLTYSELLSFLTTYMLKKLSRNENFITCIQCGKGGFLQVGPPKKQKVQCPICNEKQVIEKGVDGDLDADFKKMIKSGELRECPTCRHLTLKEKGVCNVIQCAKCGVWWNWKTKEQGHSESDLKQRARMNGTLWEPGELRYQQELEARNPKEFQALLERNGIKYDPNYIRGGWGNQ
ncbi:unnamed protein product [Rotaria socialis]|uniref:RING-type domain-containing protein n=3 Tax=Rotaria socialis TaxID=392032 RepID=A0A817MTR6_9BILA|nr:unnamed protein product [Rotaria socialis]